MVFHMRYEAAHLPKQDILPINNFLHLKKALNDLTKEYSHSYAQFRNGKYHGNN